MFMRKAGDRPIRTTSRHTINYTPRPLLTGAAGFDDEDWQQHLQQPPATADLASAERSIFCMKNLYK
jgi:hypothetical protein